MLFAVNEDRPRLVPVQIHGRSISGESHTWSPVLSHYLGDDSAWESMVILDNVGGQCVASFLFYSPYAQAIF